MTVLESLRNRALLGMLLFVVISSGVSLLVAPMFAFDQSKVLLDFGFAFMQLAGLGIIFFLGISMVAQDIQQRSACMILARPIPRRDYIVGRYLGLAIVLFVAMAAVILITGGGGLLILYTLMDIPLPRNFSFPIFLVVFFASYLSYAILLAVAFLFSVTTTNVYISMLSTFALYVTGQSLETVIKILLQDEFVHVTPLYISLLQWISWILPNFRAFDFKTYLLYGLPLQPGDIILAALYGVVYISFLLAVTCLSFSSKDV